MDLAASFDDAVLGRDVAHDLLTRAIAESAGAVPLILDPTAHDRAVALTSHAPQAVSSLLAARLAHADPSEVQVSGQGLRDVTRIAAGKMALTPALDDMGRIVVATRGGVALEVGVGHAHCAHGQGQACQ